MLDISIRRGYIIELKWSRAIENNLNKNKERPGKGTG